MIATGCILFFYFILISFYFYLQTIMAGRALVIATVFILLYFILIYFYLQTMAGADALVIATGFIPGNPFEMNSAGKK